jgi:hypothetical protein
MMWSTDVLPRRIYVAAYLGVLCACSPRAAADRPNALPDLRIAHGTKNIAEAWFAEQTTRYKHFVLGSNYEAASLVVRLRDGHELKLTLPDTHVFEDRQPRLADLDGDGTDEIVVVKTDVVRGAALAIVGVRGDKLTIIAETPPTGRANTWLNPAGIMDFNGDGRLDIAYVQMPHLLGLLRVWTLHEGKLVEIAQLLDTSNHVIGSAQLGLSAVADFDGDGTTDLAIPSRDRRTLRFLSFKNGAKEIGRRPLPSPATRDFRLDRRRGKFEVVVGLDGGKTINVTLPSN